ncbi:MAG: hypothetical protein ABIR81_08710 [Ginsengibacter sp.]
MTEQVSNTSAVFMEVTRNKIEGQDKKIAAVEEKINNIPDNTQLLQKVISSLEELRTDVNSNRFSTKTFEDFTETLNESVRIHKELITRKIVHHHHVPKVVLIAAGLFVASALVCAGWYSTIDKLDSYIANDTKYRQLRLDTANIPLQSYLDYTDSVYNLDAEVRSRVIKSEEKNRTNFERLQRAERLKAEARALENAVKKK